MAATSEFTDKIDHWADTHNLFIADILRFVFGIFLIWKGYQFGQKPEMIPVVMGRFDFLGIFLIVYIVIVQIAAGVVIMCGLITRTAILCVLPVLLGAVIYSPRATELPQATGEGWAVICLLLSLAFLVYGSGSFSCDAYYRRHPLREYKG
ncbi:MAG TPA: DoxX family protein [Bacteroidia bacterium]|jgi:uncharacterized membrane protein YphA (DoxX/SURF4 family)|nr:DoxX family protein [Bacteroidia bacterium]